MRALRVPARRAVRATGFLAVTAAMLPPFLATIAATPEARRDGVRDRWVGAWADALLALFAVAIDVRGRADASSGASPGAPPRGRLVVANHRSTIDVALLLRTFGGRMVARGDLSGWPVLGKAARSVGTIFVDRKSAVSGAATIREIRGALRAGETVCVFPEGTTFDGDDVRPFHAGTFVAALRSGADVIPVGLAYPRGSGAAFVDEPFLAHLSRMAGADPTRVVAKVGAPIPITDGARAGDLRDAARASVQALVHEARAIVDP